MKRGTKLLYKKIFAGLLGGGMLFMPNWSYALPSGGQVVTNNGTITAGGKVMDITGSGNVAIDWNSFNIAADEIVNFKNMQAVLNYVSGGSKSEIFGKLNGAGVNVFLVNPNGILFGKTAQVNVGQLTASTRSLEKAALNSFNGSLSPLDAGGAANVKADIINLGKLKAGKLVLEGNNLSIIGSDSLEVADKSKITLRAGENINIGYEVTDKTTIDVGDGKGNTHQVSDYGKGGGDKASDVLSTASVTDLKGSAKSINDAMLVHDVYELQAIDRNTGTINGSSYVVGNYMLAGDIDAGDTKNWNSGRGFDPIGRLNRTGNGVTGSFSGAFDGICHSIQNLYIRQIGNQYDGYIGLFEGIGKGGSVGNVNMAGGHIEGTSNFGSIAGLNWGTIYNIVNSAELVCSSGGVGGIVGTNGGVIRNAVNNGTLKIDGRSGGITGYNGDTVWGNTGILLDVKNNGDITSESMGGIGGITGINSSGSSITGAENTGLVELKDGGGSEVGGISGDNDGLIENVKNSGNIKGHIYSTNVMGVSCVGGISGSNKGTVNGESYNTGDVEAGGYGVGGIIGYNYGESIVEHVYNKGNVTGGSQYVGGIAGSSQGELNNVFNTGAVASGVSGAKYIGGIAGYSVSVISNAYNTGNVGSVRAQYVGGIAGYSKTGTIENCWNSGEIAASHYLGGIAGYNNSDIRNCYNEGAIIGMGSSQYIAGIAGNSKSGTITNVYNLGEVTGYSQNYGVIIGAGDSVISNSYYKTDTGYKKYGDDSEYESIEAFNAAFLAGMTDSDKALWLTYGDRMPPLLKGLLKPLDINVGDIETEYTGGDYTGLAQALADKLAEQGIIIDVTKLLADGKTEIGEYDLKDLLFSTQDGYALNVTGKLVIKEKSPEPEPPADNYAPSSDSKYTGTLTNIKAEKMQQEEYRNLDKRRRNTIEQASVSVEGDGIKLE